MTDGHRYVIDPTDDDLRECVAKDPGDCLYAVCIKRAIPSARRVYVRSEWLAFTIGNHRFTYVVKGPLAKANIIALDELRFGDIQLPAPLVLEHPEITECQPRRLGQRIVKGEGHRTVVVKRGPTTRRLAGRGVKPR